MASGQVIRLVNEGDTAFVDAYNSQPFTIPPHGNLFVDWDAMCLWLGHPEANDFDPRNRVRVAEYARLRCRYGVDARALQQTLDGVAFNDDDLFQQMRPKLSAYDASSGQQILTVADDPSGDSLSPSIEPSGNNMDAILARLSAMEQESANLRAQLAANQRTEQALNDAQPIPIDDSGMTPPPLQPADIAGTITESPAEPSVAPRPPTRTTPSEDTPTRVRVSG